MSVSLKQTIVPAFGRHETFTLRYAWLKRAYDAHKRLGLRAEIDPRLYLFNRDGDEDTDAAHQLLGVGKNMAKSIRFWLQACRILEEHKPEGSRLQVGETTRFGDALLDTERGLDPYLEHGGTWWLLHWMMLSPGSYLPVWWSAFHTFSAVQFTTGQLLEHVTAQVSATSSWSQPKGPKTTTLKRDVLALLRNYAGTSGSRKRDKIDDELDSPFVPLTLVRPADEPDTFRFGVGPKPGLPPSIAAFSVLDFLSRTQNTARTVLVATLATEQGGPGRAFKLTERDLSELLHKAAADEPDLLRMTQAAGSEALAVASDEPFGVVAAHVLHRHYTRLGRHPRPVGAMPYLPHAETRLIGEWT